MMTTHEITIFSDGKITMQRGSPLAVRGFLNGVKWACDNVEWQIKDDDGEIFEETDGFESARKQYFAVQDAENKKNYGQDVSNDDMADNHCAICYHETTAKDKVCEYCVLALEAILIENTIDDLLDEFERIDEEINEAEDCELADHLMMQYEDLSEEIDRRQEADFCPVCFSSGENGDCDCEGDDREI